MINDPLSETHPVSTHADKNRRLDEAHAAIARVRDALGCSEGDDPVKVARNLREERDALFAAVDLSALVSKAPKLTSRPLRYGPAHPDAKIDNPSFAAFCTALGEIRMLPPEVGMVDTDAPVAFTSKGVADTVTLPPPTGVTLVKSEVASDGTASVTLALDKPTLKRPCTACNAAEARYFPVYSGALCHACARAKLPPLESVPRRWPKIVAAVVGAAAAVGGAVAVWGMAPLP